MNENESKVFLKRFFSFNVPAIFTTGSNNASFDEGNELEHLKSTSQSNEIDKSTKDDLFLESSNKNINNNNNNNNNKQTNFSASKLNEKDSSKKLTTTTSEFSYIIESNNNNKSISNVSQNSNTSELLANKKKNFQLANENLREVSAQNVANLEKEKLINETNKKIDFGTINRRKNFKKSTDSSKCLITRDSNYMMSASDTIEFFSSNASEDQGQQTTTTTQTIQSENSKLNNSNQEILINLNENNEKNNNVELLKSTQSQLQQQQSIELVPFRKKGVQINENENLNCDKKIDTNNEKNNSNDNNNNSEKLIDMSPLLALSFNLSNPRPQHLLTPNNNKQYFFNYPSIEFRAKNVVSNAIKYRLVIFRF
jgi:hypothetical protein